MNHEIDLEPILILTEKRFDPPGLGSSIDSRDDGLTDGERTFGNLDSGVGGA
jgi:hypothetical protein